jgi:GNAT superfamily N-acetyltransferase
MDCVFSSADRELAARLEGAEAANAMAMAQAAVGSLPGASFETFGGGTAVFAGIESPLTHALGIGFRGTVPEEEMERMETFFRERGSPCLIDLCPMADASVVAFVQSRPYRAVEFNNVLARRIGADEVFERSPGVRPASECEMATWSRVIAEGFSDPMPASEELMELLAVCCAGSQCWFGGDGDPAGGGALGIQNGVALFYGDATLPLARRKGWQALLIRERLAAAQRQGCDLGMVSVLPGSTSHRNYERAGFQLIYMRVNVSREFEEQPAVSQAVFCPR